jgi:Cys-tRNA(Pro)/Cys-tRNA(Cys) deacylase
MNVNTMLTVKNTKFFITERLMTPAVVTLKQHNAQYIIHQYEHDVTNQHYGLEAAEKLGVNVDIVFKTLIVSIDNNQLVVAILPVSSMLNMKLIAKAHGGKKAVMALPIQVERTTGYVLGGVSPLGQKKQLTTYIDSSIDTFTTVYVSGGKRGVELELSPDVLQSLTQATLVNLCQLK